MTDFPDRVAAASDDAHAVERARLVVSTNNVDLIVGSELADFGYTRMVLRETTPAEWEKVAAYLFALTQHVPIKDSDHYQPHRILLGAFASELRRYAKAMGEPTGLHADLRAASTKAQRKRVEERMAVNRELLHAYVSDMLASETARQG